MSSDENKKLCDSELTLCHPEFISGSASVSEFQFVKWIDAETSLSADRHAQHGN
jgi:hypothetical protein